MGFNPHWRKTGSFSLRDDFHDLFFLFRFRLTYLLKVWYTTWKFFLETGIEMFEALLLTFALVIKRFAESADVCSIWDTAPILLVDGNLLSGALICFEHFWKLIIRILNMSLFEQLQI